MRMSDELVCDPPIEEVFDVVTTARYWPQWHPATRRVEGDVDGPTQLGHRITEHVTIAGTDGTGTWTVVERDRPHHLALETDLHVGHLRISYWFSATAGGTRCRRDLDIPDLGPQVKAAMQAQSTQGMANLARLLRRPVPARK
jgi:uncharacterized protein YndB with AHSA1/START domain